MHDVIIWSIIGIILMGIEILGLQGIGILFSGFAAITVSICVYLDHELNGNIGLQLIYFFIFTIIWSGILWYPLKGWIQYGDSGDYKNIIGNYVILRSEMKKNEITEISWSGTKIRAMIDPDNQNDYIPSGTNVKISQLVDGVIYVTDKLQNEKV